CRSCQAFSSRRAKAEILTRELLTGRERFSRTEFALRVGMGFGLWCAGVTASTRHLGIQTSTPLERMNPSLSHPVFNRVI
ncbi:MAG: hypothetical protein M3R68_08110, partial [Acidobacteriota bacterium]|nr:hypothetical protein [Acidobacteriota bacterium]